MLWHNNYLFMFLLLELRTPVLFVKACETFFIINNLNYIFMFKVVTSFLSTV